MDGIQKTIAEALKELLLSVEGGKYGQDDEFDVKSFEEDCDDIVFNAN